MGPGTVVVRRFLAGLFTGVWYVFGLVRATAFWGTILLPLVIVGVLVTGAATSDPLALALLVGLNLCCIVVGRRYSPDE